MSNSVDILLIDGPYSGLILCQPRPVPATITHAGETYTPDTYAGIHVAYYDPGAVVADVDALIAASGLTQAWDLA